MKKIKAAIIGTGGISHLHTKGYLERPDVELAALCDLDREKALRYAEKYGVDPSHVYTDYNEMLAAEKLDCVSVCTWNAAHAPATIAALNAGCHVLCEKPMAMNSAEARAMQEAADRNHRVLQIGFVRRFGADAGVAREMIDAGTVGEIYYGKATYLRRHGFPGGWFGDKAYSGGGPLIDLGVHVIDLSRYLMGNPRPVSVYGATFHKLGNRPEVRQAADVWSSTTKESRFEFTVEDLATAMIRFDNGAILSVECSFDLNIEKGSGDITLFGTKAGLQVSPEIALFTNQNGYMANVSLANKVTFDEAAFNREVSHFVDCGIACDAGKPFECRSPGTDGIVIMQILESIYKSGETGHEVVIGE
ncbi:MAG: Gfo/Idh/MocA family oxidoreductase [Clostridiaceae bacterium]|nr:Gfo/Idh/MocA family oxidoreductase [Clostridiales bacterium]MDD6876409.1 Gfo/Idh/MocA family oxidoreductase [Clostridiaceae bacterium]MDY3287316.1 Gfo/Idh/MocA family oxidoreductase [Eubacteriales bacterium]MDY5015211.1 Gfo/Idh/MocA family oxidoreductase [Eubacteriales bacterium]